MNSLFGTVRQRIEAQGFCGLDDTACVEINYALRLSPAICMTWAALGTALSSATILWTLMPFAALGVILPKHPFDVFYDYGLRHLLESRALPRYGFRRRFACAMATLMIMAAAYAFQSGMLTVGHIVGWSLALTAFINVSAGFCVPSFVLRLLTGRTACKCV